MTPSPPPAVRLPTAAELPPITLDGYHGHPAISSSALKKATTGTMRAYWARYVDPDAPPYQPTEAMRQGSLVDALITRPDHFHRLYCVIPEDAPRRPTAKQLVDGRDSRAGTKAHDAWLDAQARKCWWDEYDAKTAGCEAVPHDWMVRAEQIREVLLAHPEIGPILQGALITSQEPFVWDDPELGCACRYLPDVETEDMALWDLKKARSANPRAVVNQSHQLGYDVQLAHYRKGYIKRNGQKPSSTGLICYEWDYPHDCCLLPATEALLLYGEERRSAVWQRIRECMTADYFPSYETTALDVPGWLKRGEEAPAPVIEEIVLF